MAYPRNSSRSAFALVELLVVLGIMALFVGVFSTALRPGSLTVAVEGAQAQMASLLTQARGVAALKNAPARLIIHNDNTNPDRYLRFAGIVYAEDENDNGTIENTEWLPATDGITLPKFTYAYVDDFANMDLTGGSIEYISNTSEDYAFIEFNPNGTVSKVNGASPRLAVSSGQPNQDGSITRGDEDGNVSNVRGAIVRIYGSFVLLNEPDAFPSES